MDEMKYDWNDLRLFLAVARGRGLAAAAAETGRSAPTLGRRMLALERSMGRDLFVRHARGYEMTEDGRKLFDDLSDIEARMVRLTARRSEEGLPLVKVSAGTWTTLTLLENLDAITGVPADIRLRFLSTENRLNIPHREVVIGFRNQRPTEGNLAGRRLSRVEFAPYTRKGAPRRWIKVLADTPSARWLEKTFGNDAVCEVNVPRNSLDLALAGKGIALLPTFVGEAHGALVRTGDVIAELAHDQWIVTHQDDRHLSEVRRAIDRMCRVLQRR